MDPTHLPSFIASPWVPGEFNASEPPSYPLERYFPPVPKGMVPDWVKNYASPGAYILDPFGQNPITSLELARAGYRLLISANNPIAAFVLKVLAQAPSYQDFSQALSSLTNNKMRDGSSIEEYLRAFYRIDCPNEACQTAETPGRFEVSTFIWADEPEQGRRITHAIGECPLCGFKGEVETSEAILETQGKTPSYALIRSQVLERIAGQDPPLRRMMEEVVNFYSPRALIALHLLLNKIETSNLSQDQIQLLQALWLTAADTSNQLWIWPRSRHRPKQLIRPPVYQEANVWEAFVNSVGVWVHDLPEVKLREWPKRVPPSGGISLFEGRLREMEDKPELDLISLVQCSLPRRNQAFWNLSGLWSGWLWGKEGVKTIRNTLLRQRYDWTWHSVALRKVLSQLPALIRNDVPVLLLTSELENLFLLAGMLGAQAAGLKLSSAAIDGENDLLQTVWRLPFPTTLFANKTESARTIRDSGKNFLKQLGEPTQWLRLLSHTVADLLANGALLNRPRADEMLNDIEAEFAVAFNEVAHFQRFNPGTTPEAGLYWIARDSNYLESMADRAEAVILQELQTWHTLTMPEIHASLYAVLPGFLTPPDALITEILESYSTDTDEDPLVPYTIHPRETASARSQDLVEIRGLIEQMADQLEFRREILPDRIIWMDKQGEISTTFFPISTARISSLLAENRNLPGEKIIVLPGSRSNLIAYKLKRDPNLKLLKSEDWQLVKYRQLRNLANNPLLSHELFASQINSDPPEFHTRQLALF